MSLTISPVQIVEMSKSPLLAVPDSWTRRSLGEVARIVNGFAFKSKQFVPEGGKPLIRIRDIFNDATSVGFVGEYDDTYIVRPDQLIVGMDGDFNCARWRGPDALLNQRVCKIVPDEDQLDIDFLTYVLPGYLEAIHDVTSSTTVTHLSSRDVAQIPIPVPSLKEQRTLARLLGVVSGVQRSSASHLATARRASERLRQSVLAAACSGRLTADWREEHSDQPAARIPLDDRSTRGSSKRTRTLASFSPADLPELPDTWTWTPLAAVSERILGKMLDKDKNRGELRPYLRNINVRWRGFDLSDVHEMRFEAGEGERYGVGNGDVLVCEGGEPGRAAVWRDDSPDMRFQKALHRVRCDRRLLPDWLVTVLQAHAASGLLQRYFTGSGIAHLTGVSLARVPVPLPPRAEQVEMVHRIERLLPLADRFQGRLEEVERSVHRSSRAVLGRALRGELLDESLALASEDSDSKHATRTQRDEPRPRETDT